MNIQHTIDRYLQSKPISDKVISSLTNLGAGRGGDCCFLSIAHCLQASGYNQIDDAILRKIISDFYLDTQKFSNGVLFNKITSYIELKKYIKKKLLEVPIWTFQNYLDNAKTAYQKILKSDNLLAKNFRDLILNPFINLGMEFKDFEISGTNGKIVLPLGKNAGFGNDLWRELGLSKTVQANGLSLYFNISNSNTGINTENIHQDILAGEKRRPVIDKITYILNKIASEGNYFYTNKDKSTEHLYFTISDSDGIRGGPLGYWTPKDFEKIESIQPGKEFLNNFLMPLRILYSNFVKSTAHWGDSNDIEILEKSLSTNIGKKINIIVFIEPYSNNCIFYQQFKKKIDTKVGNLFLTIYNPDNMHYQAFNLNINNKGYKCFFNEDDFPNWLIEWIHDCQEGAVNTLSPSIRQNLQTTQKSKKTKKKSKESSKVILNQKSMEYYISENGGKGMEYIKTKCFIAHTKKGNFISFLQGNFLSVTDYQYLINPGDNQNYFYSDKRYKINKFRQDKSFCILVDLSKIKFPFNPYFLKLDNGNYVLYSKIVSFYQGTERINFGIYGDMDINQVITKLNSEFTNIQEGGIFFEKSHTFIQWLFPNTEFSPYNPDADLINDHTVRIWDISSDAQKNLKQILKIILKYWGFGDKLSKHNTNIVGNIFDVKNNHNWKRISRLLIFLREMGMGTLSKELHNHLIKIISAYFSNPKKQLSTALTKSMEIWNKKVIEKRELKQEFNNSDFTLQNIFEVN